MGLAIMFWVALLGRKRNKNYTFALIIFKKKDWKSFQPICKDDPRGHFNKVFHVPWLSTCPMKVFFKNFIDDADFFALLNYGKLGNKACNFRLATISNASFWTFYIFCEINPYGLLLLPRFLLSKFDLIAGSFLSLFIRWWTIWMPTGTPNFCANGPWSSPSKRPSSKLNVRPNCYERPKRPKRPPSWKLPSNNQCQQKSLRCS